jgi:GntR family transcriptional regulator, transcriptional repressor for pyruvate dehydrogenase complex
VVESTQRVAHGMNILPLRRMRVPEEIVTQIRTSIANGELQPGDRLPSERELAERFQVSRASIREALTALQVLGLLERSRSGGGLSARGNHVWFTIAPLSSYLSTRSHLVEQIEVRRMIEPEMGRLAAERATAADIARMEACLREMSEDIAAGGIGSDADAAFHSTIAESTSNELLVRLIEVVGAAIREHRELFQTAVGARQSLKEHRRMLDAIRGRDGEAAYQSTREHIDTVRRLLEDALNVTSPSGRGRA